MQHTSVLEVPEFPIEANLCEESSSVATVFGLVTAEKRIHVKNLFH
jgi:hypothetical protein